jgi:hypothetical protein
MSGATSTGTAQELHLVRKRSATMGSFLESRGKVPPSQRACELRDLELLDEKNNCCMG